MTNAVAKLEQSNQQVAVNPMQLLSMAVEANADIEKLERLMALQERWEANEARKAFDEAMSAFKSEAPKINKNCRVQYTSKKDNSVTDYKHASLDHICHTINPILAKHGLSYSWDTHQENGTLTVTCIVAHRMGHRTRTPLMSTPDTSGGKNAIQSIGSTTTYLSRYTLLAALGLSTEGEDDDGAGAEAQAPETITDDQVAEILKAIEVSGMTLEGFCRKAQIEEVQDLHSARYSGAMQMLKKRAQEAGQ